MEHTGRTIDKHRRLLRHLAALAVAAYVLSGVYMVRTDEVGVLRRFGRAADPAVQPGLHYRIPWPVDKVDKVKVNETKRVTIGFQMPDQVLRRAANPALSQFLTGDENLMNLQAVVQFSVGDPSRFLFRATDPSETVRMAAESAMMDAVARTTVDELWTTGQVRLAAKVHEGTQKLLLAYDMGIQVRAVNLQSIAPPQEVSEAFHDVASARQEREKIQHEAEAYMSEAVLRAQGEAKKLLSDAEALRHEKINQATGDRDRFAKMHAEYERAKSVTATRLYIEAMEEILPRLQKVIVDSSQSSPIDLGLVDAYD
jgi:membrane protease subunit HflK